MTRITAYTANFDWVEKPFGLKINETQAKFIQDTFKLFTRVRIASQSSQILEKDANLYQILKMALYEELTLENIGKSLFEDYEKLKEEFKETFSTEEGPVGFFLKKAVTRKIKLTPVTKALFSQLEMRNNELLTKDLLALSAPFIEEDSKISKKANRNELMGLFWGNLHLK